jgi:hypothetical protein
MHELRWPKCLYDLALYLKCPLNNAKSFVLKNQYHIMKSIILLHFVSLMMLQLVAQPKTVNIQGIVKDTTVKRIEISHVVDATLTKFEHDTLNVLNGAFNTSIQIPFPTEIGISYGK